MSEVVQQPEVLEKSTTIKKQETKQNGEPVEEREPIRQVERGDPPAHVDVVRSPTNGTQGEPKRTNSIADEKAVLSPSPRSNEDAASKMNENDSRLVNSSNSIFLVKKERKKIENDTKTLANRVSLLKHEEQKALKKIEDTKRKAEEIWSLKILKEERERQREEMKKHKDSGLKNSQLDMSTFRQQKRAEREAIRNALFESKRKETMEIKKQRELNEQKKKELQDRMRLEKEEKHNFIRDGHNQASEKLKAFKAMKLKEMKDYIELKKSDEEKAKNEIARNFQDLEIQEADLIQKLQSSQEVQKSAFEELQQALLLSPKAFAEKYGLDPQKKTARILQTQTARDNFKEDNESEGKVKEYNGSRVASMIISVDKMSPYGSPPSLAGQKKKLEEKSK